MILVKRSLAVRRLAVGRQLLAIQWLHHRRGYRLDGERPGDPLFALVHQRLVVECFLPRMSGNGGINLRLCHAFVDVRVVGDGAERHVRNGFVAKTAAHALVGMGKLVEVVECGHQALLGQRERDARGVAGDPATPPLFGNIGRGAAATGRIEHQVTRVGGHQHAPGDDSAVCLYGIHLAIGTGGYRPKGRSGQPILCRLQRGHNEEVYRQEAIFQPKLIYPCLHAKSRSHY